MSSYMTYLHFSQIIFLLFRYPSGVRPSLGMYNQTWQHYENPATKRRLHDLLSISGMLDNLQCYRPPTATVEDLLR